MKRQRRRTARLNVTEAKPPLSEKKSQSNDLVFKNVEEISQNSDIVSQKL